MADDENAVIASEIFARQEIAAELRLNAERGEEIRGRAKRPDHLGRLAGFREAGVAQGVGGDLAVSLHLALQIEEVSGRDAADWVLRRGAVDPVQLRAVWIGKRF